MRTNKKTGDNIDENQTSIDQLDEDELRTYCEEMEELILKKNKEILGFKKTIKEVADRLNECTGDMDKRRDQGRYPEACGCARAYLNDARDTLRLKIKE